MNTEEVLNAAKKSGEEHCYVSEFTHECEVDNCIDGCVRSYLDGVRYVLNIFENVADSTDLDEALGDFRETIEELKGVVNELENY